MRGAGEGFFFGGGGPRSKGGETSTRKPGSLQFPPSGNFLLSNL